MRRRFPTALLFIAGLIGAAAQAADEPVLPPIASVALSGGFSARDTLLPQGLAQVRPTEIRGISPWLVRLRADYFPVRWLGVEGEGLGDFFTAIQPNNARLTTPSLRGAIRLGAVLRFVTTGGFVLSGSLGYGFSWAPVIVLSPATPLNPVPDTVLSDGPVGRLSVGYAGHRFEGVVSVVALAGFFDKRVNSLEPQLWLAGRIAELGPTSLWVGLDAGLLLESSGGGYGGATLRFALALKVQLLPPAPPPLIAVTVNPTTLQVQVTLPDGTPAFGALVALDGAAAAPIDALGQLVVTTNAGAHAATAKLSGYRDATGTVEVVEGKQAVLVLQLEALTGPGQLSGVVRASATAAPVPSATVTAGEAPPVQTSADGNYRFEKLGPGPVKVRIEAQGFTTAEEVAQVPPESAATLDVQLEALGKGSPATVRGLIRSRTGEPLKASVVIKGLSTKVAVTPEGRFFVTVPGGTYQFIISAPGYVTQTRKVVLADGDQAIVHTELQKVSK